MIQYHGKATPRLEVLKQHLRGVKKRLLWVFVAFGIGSSLAWWFFPHLIAFLLWPAGGLLSESGKPIFTAPTDMFNLKIHLAMRVGLLVALPVLLYHIARFLWPFLSSRYRRFVALFLPASLVCYLVGTAFAYYVLLPTGLKFLLSFGTDTAEPMIRITEYLSLVYAMLFWLGVVFELPLAMYLLAKMRLVTYPRFKKFRRYVPWVALFFGALITPTADVVNQTLVTVPLILLFELGVLLAWAATRKRL